MDTIRGYAIIGDCGGTNARLQLCEFSKESHKPKVLKYRFYLTNDYPEGLTQVLAEFLKDTPAGSEIYPTIAVIAMGCTVKDNVADYFVNSNWPKTVAEEVAAKLGFKQVTLINDFVARGWGLLELQENELAVVNQGEPSLYGTKLAIGPGTGLGFCFVNFQDDCNGKMQPGVHASEVPSTHSTYHSETDREFARFFL